MVVGGLSHVDQRTEKVVVAEHLDWVGRSGLSLGSQLEGEEEIWFPKWQSWGDADAASSRPLERGTLPFF